MKKQELGRRPEVEQVGILAPVGTLKAVQLAAAAHGQRPGEWLRSVLLGELARAGHPVARRMPAGNEHFSKD